MHFGNACGIAELHAVGQHFDLAVLAGEDLQVAVGQRAARQHHQPVADLRRQRHHLLLAVALECQLDRRLGIGGGQQFAGLVDARGAGRGIDRLAVDADDAVAALQPAGGGGAVGGDPGDAHAGRFIGGEQHADHRLAQRAFLDPDRRIGAAVLAAQFRIALGGLVEVGAGGIEFLLLRRGRRGLGDGGAGQGHAQCKREGGRFQREVHVGLVSMKR